MPRYEMNKEFSPTKNSLVYYVYDTQTGVIVDEFLEDIAQSMAIHFQLETVCQYCGSSHNVEKKFLVKDFIGTLCESCWIKYIDGLLLEALENESCKISS